MWDKLGQQVAVEREHSIGCLKHTGHCLTDAANPIVRHALDSESQGRCFIDLIDLIVEVVFYGRNHANGFHKAAVCVGIAFAVFAGAATLIGGQNRENTLIRLPNRSDLAA